MNSHLNDISSSLLNQLDSIQQLSTSFRGFVQSILTRSPLPPKIQLIGTNETILQVSMLAATKRFSNVVLVVPSHRDVSSILSFLEHNQSILADEKITACHLPYLSMWGNDRFINPNLNRKQRLHALWHLQQNLQPQATIIVTTVAGLFQSTMPRSLFEAFNVTVNVGDEVDQDQLIKKFEKAGYRHSSVVDEEGLFSVRGAIVDIFPSNLDMPIRIEFTADTIGSLRLFQLEDQKSKKNMEGVTIGPANEILIEDHERKAAAQRLHDALIAMESIPEADKTGIRGAFITGERPVGWDLLGALLRPESCTGLDLLPENSCLIFAKGIDASLAGYHQLLSGFKDGFDRDLKSSRLTIPPGSHYPDASTVLNKIYDFPHILEFSNPVADQKLATVYLTPETGFEPVSPGLSGSARFDGWCQTMTHLLQYDDANILILASNTDQMERISTLLSHRELPIGRSQVSLLSCFDDYLNLKKSPSQIHVTTGFLASWLWLNETKTLVIPEHVIFGVIQKRQKSSSAKLKNFLSSFKDLKVGDLVVHMTHGVGRYKGMIALTVGGTTSDFLHLEYAGSDKVYLPVDRLNMLQRYSSSSDSSQAPSLDKLGGSSWDKKKQKVKAAVKEMADRLLKLQAQRELSHVHQFETPSDDYFTFEAEFPFEETDDQLKAIADVNADLQAPKAMDRLICGDVGFGKTEVALRAAFRVVSDGFQTLVLVPTTILCYQHFRTFNNRLSRHGIRVAQLNRFVSTKDQKQTLIDLAEGKVDVLVGTHRLLSQDIKPKRLGLLIVDEEQRFGVVHKEKLKELRAGADILTLTATPIPRTLHMSMLGLRDISIITTPPNNRMSVKTYIARLDESIIKDAIEHEIDRGGQVFFLHNRVEDIESTVLWVKSLAPKAHVKFAHGQMKETDLETTIIDFIEHKFDVLVCTTIIESGVDMPNVNTLIVANADRFGLAQLYQMRGRVGRSSVQAYAYFLTKNPDQLTDESRRRLDVLAAHQELGAGFQIASHDLEIRGAGNLLGADQSGHASDVGLEMYTDLLSEAIAEIKGQEVELKKMDTEIKLSVTALIPETFIKEEGLRLQFYKMLFSVESSAEITQLRAELTDRFGEPPEVTKRLFLVAHLKVMLSLLGASQISSNPQSSYFEIRFGSLKEPQIDRIIVEAKKRPRVYRLSPDYKLFVYWDPAVDGGSLASADPMVMLGKIIERLEPLIAGLE